MENEEKKELVNPESMSLWRELNVAMTLIVVMILESLNYRELSEHLSCLSKVCADSKRKRKPQMLFFNSA